MSGGALARAVVSRPGDLDPVVVRVAELSYSWAVSNGGLLSGRVPAEEANAAGIADWLGRWIRTEHPTAGQWAGVVTDTDLDFESGVLELAGLHFTHALLDARTTPRTYVQDTLTTGGLVARALQESSRDSRLWIDQDMRIDESGDVLSYVWRGEPLTGLLGSLAGGVWEYRIRESDLVFEWQQQIGTNRDDRELVVGRHVAGGSYARSLYPVVNELLAIGDDRATATSEAHVAEDEDSIVAYDRRQGTRFYPSVSSRQALKARAAADLPALAYPPQALRLTVVDADGCFAWFREGDRIRVRVPAADAVLDLRVKARTLNADGTMSVAGDAEDAA